MVSGEVHLPEGTPAVRASVLLIDDSARGDVGTGEQPMLENDLQTLTDSLGRFEFRAIAPGSRRLIAVEDDFPPVMTPPFPVEDNHPRILTLLRGVTLEGMTAPGARLRVVTRGIPGPPRLPLLPVPSSEADPEGRYRLSPIPAEFPFLVEATSPHCRSRTFGPFTFPAGTHQENLPLLPGFVLEGRVVAPSGVGIESARVTLRGRSTLSGVDGRYLLEGLDEEPGTLLVSRPGFCPEVRPGVGPGRQEVTLDPSLLVRGRLLGPRPPGPVTIVHERSGVQYRSHVAADGRFELEGVSPGPRSVMVEDAAGRIIAEQRLQVPEETEGREVLLTIP